MDEKVMLSSGGDDPIQIELTSNDVLLVNGHEASDQEIADALREILRRLRQELQKFDDALDARIDAESVSLEKRDG
jgi:hypothetical protein